jgi:hypothetical protein
MRHPERDPSKVVEESVDESAEVIDAETAEELPPDIEIDSAGNRWRRAFRDREGVFHGREAVVPVRTPPPEGPAAGIGRYDRSHLDHPRLGGGA